MSLRHAPESGTADLACMMQRQGVHAISQATRTEQGGVSISSAVQGFVRSVVQSFLRAFVLFLAWSAYALGWWWVVLKPNPELLGVVTTRLGAIVIGLVLLSLLWIAHNVRLARRGSRGRATRWVPLNYEEDALDHPVQLGPGLEDAAVVSVYVDADGRKHFQPGPGADLTQAEVPPTGPAA